MIATQVGFAIRGLQGDIRKPIRAMTAAHIPRIAIVGAGFSGSLLAVHLTRQSVGPLEIVMIDRNGSRGRGLAYSANNPNHLLNVRVENMSAFPDLPGHFRDWLERRTGRHADALAFVSRGLYGAYVEDVLATALGRADGQVAITQIAANCVDLRSGAGAWTLRLSDESSITADAVALCLGHFPPRLPVAVESAVGADERIIADPWDLKAFGRIQSRDRVVVIGSGLTMADVVVHLQDQGHEGRIDVVSRRGLQPNVHEPTAFWPAFIDPDRPPPTSRALLRLVRREVESARKKGVDWRAVIDSLRPNLIPLWRALPLVEQKRALRHLRPYWDTHRHRIAPEIDARLRKREPERRLRLLAGSLVSARATHDAIEIDFRRRASAEIETLRADWLVNCTGPTTAYERIDDPLVRVLLDQGLARPDDVGLGIEVTRDCNVIGPAGQPHDRLFATGPLTRGAFWEMLAVPELRRQAPEVARQMLSSLPVDTNAGSLVP
jgi:uncharacterized NAD(P)/FAD-binding protein YdhS